MSLLTPEEAQITQTADKTEAAKESSDTSDSDSDSVQEPEIEWIACEGDSSDEEEPAKASARAHIGLFNWPCPRSYPAQLEDRRKLKQLKPEDLSKEEQNGIMLKAGVCFMSGLFVSKFNYGFCEVPAA